MTSHGVASTSDPVTLAALKAKYPPRTAPIPTQVPKGQAVAALRLRDPFLNLQPGTAPGTGQQRPEYLTSLAETWEEGDPRWDLLERFALRYVNGSLPAWFYKCCLTVETVGLYKTAEQDPSAIRRWV